MREHILGEIRRLAEANGGRAPGRRHFEKETGIRTSDWYGRYWARWGDALREAGFAPNEKQGRSDQAFLLDKLVQACRHYGRVPTHGELRLYRKIDAKFPSHGAIANNFPTKAELVLRLREWVKGKPDYSDVNAMLPAEGAPGSEASPVKSKEGFVYLLRSGVHYKVGHSDEIERRVKEITIALPEAVTMIHTIRTDDPSGIEAYWHRRFADRRANGEWFRLTPGDVAAFKRRKYQ